MAEDGTEITLADNGRRLTALVQTTPFYDPDQERLRA
jgi:glycine cleavage system aminomethyltransferase T